MVLGGAEKSQKERWLQEALLPEGWRIGKLGKEVLEGAGASRVISNHALRAFPKQHEDRISEFLAKFERRHRETGFAFKMSPACSKLPFAQGSKGMRFDLILVDVYTYAPTNIAGQESLEIRQKKAIGKAMEDLNHNFGGIPAVILKDQRRP